MPHSDPEKKRELARKYREADPEKHRESNRKYREANPEKTRERDRKYREANPEKTRESNRKYQKANKEGMKGARCQRQYGLTGAQWLALLESQGRKCKICRKSITERTANTDHDHTKGFGTHRALLCKTCNTRLGILEKTEWIAAAAYYLDEVGSGEWDKYRRKIGRCPSEPIPSASTAIAEPLKASSE